MKIVQLSPLVRETRGLKFFPLFTLLGWLLIGFAIAASLFIVSQTGAAYWGGNAKALRDAAESGTLLASQLSTLASWAKFLPPLIFLGVASFMVGIAMEFASIPSILDRRIVAVKKALPVMARYNR